MEITYFGVAAFRLKGVQATVVCDPYSPKVGFRLPSLTAEIVLVSHQHDDHNFTKGVGGTKDRREPVVITAPGEYEVSEVAVYGYATWHDNKEGAERGGNTVYLAVVDGVRIAHLGDLGHMLSERLVEELAGVDVMLIPVGGEYTIGVAAAVKIIEAIQPAIVVPMHYKLPGLARSFDKLVDEQEFVKAVGGEVKREDKLVVVKSEIPEPTEYVVLTAKFK